MLLEAGLSTEIPKFLPIYMYLMLVEMKLVMLRAMIMGMGTKPQ